MTEVTYSTFRAQPPGEYSHRPAGTQTPLDWHPRSFSWHPNRYEAGTQSLFESDQPNERTRNALILFRVALYDCLWRRSNSERDPPTRPLSRSGFLLFVLFVLWCVRVRGTSRGAASPPTQLLVASPDVIALRTRPMYKPANLHKCSSRCRATPPVYKHQPQKLYCNCCREV